MGAVTSGFGYRDSPINGKNEFHLALDIGAEEGDEIGAFASGVVEYIGESDEFGNYLKIRHENNVSSFYAHCSKLSMPQLMEAAGQQPPRQQPDPLIQPKQQPHQQQKTGAHLLAAVHYGNATLLLTALWLLAGVLRRESP